ncbi:hypothetical protein G5I_09658 [Acromyrmex echinatior]|uniref:Uncharacterized protein n=1 Tax=Acromyrmex echinatior TaxID=103372 RepID=F4WUT0_ACREC|nr:hypothetical protein G5I_09658 [Acromyrmex echinatior]
MRVSVKVDLLVGSRDDQVYGIINGSVDVNARRDQEAGIIRAKWFVCIAKVPTLRSWSKTAISFATVENNEPADAKNSKDTVMSEVDQELGGSRAKERQDPAQRERWKKDGRRMWQKGTKEENWAECTKGRAISSLRLTNVTLVSCF